MEQTGRLRFHRKDFHGEEGQLQYKAAIDEIKPRLTEPEEHFFKLCKTVNDVKGHIFLHAEKGSSWSQKERPKKIFTYSSSPLSTCHNMRLLSA